jgi:putative membrane protein
MNAITFKKTLLLLTAIFFAAACNTGSDSNRNNTNDNTTPAQSGNAESGARRDTVTADGTMYQGGNSNANTSQNSSGSQQNNTSPNQQGKTGTMTDRQTGGGGTGSGTAGAGPTVQGTGSNSGTRSNMQNNQGNMSSNISASDRNFAMEAYKGGRMEVRMANIATERAQNPRVKDFANMMIRDHTKANNELETILSRENLMSQVEKETNDDTHMQDMRTKTGRDFDVAYMRMMVNDHNKTVDLFKNESNNGADNDLKAFASKTLSVLRMHQDSAKAIYSSLNNATTTRH